MVLAGLLDICYIYIFLRPQESLLLWVMPSVLVVVNLALRLMWQADHGIKKVMPHFRHWPVYIYLYFLTGYLEAN